MDAARGLAERLRPTAQDRAAEVHEVVRETAELLGHWILERPRSWGVDPGKAGSELEAGLEEWCSNQAWRGSVANFLHGLRKSFALLADSGELREGLARELGEWSSAHDSRASSSGGPLPNPRDIVPHALRNLRRGDEILVHGRSTPILESLTAAQHAGLFPRVTVALGAADQSGKRMARQLASEGLKVRLIWDAALLDAVPAADQVWLATEGVGSGSFLSLVGCGPLLAAAARLEIPTRVLCTSDVCLPGGEIDPPLWGASESWNLWSRAPEGVELEAQPFEINDGDAVTSWITEEGPTDLATLCTRHLVLEPASACGEHIPIEQHDTPPVPAPERQ